MPDGYSDIQGPAPPPDTVSYRQRSGRSGVTLVYTILIMTVLLGFASLAVDFGRAQVAKTKLNVAADAAARYGATGASDGTAASKAIAIAALNKANGTSVVLQSGDVVTGNYNPHLSPTYSNARTPLNAVQVTAQRTKARNNVDSLIFASLIGQNSLDLHSTAIAYCGPPLKALLVVGSLPLNTADAMVSTHLYALGYTVIAKDQNTSVAADATGMGIVVVSESVSSGVVGARYRDVTVPVLFYEPLIFDDMQLCAPTFGTDYGFDNPSDTVTINVPSHPIAAGLTGNVVVLNSAATYNWGYSQSGGVAVAYFPGTTRAAILAYDTGSQMYGMKAPNRRVTWICNSYCQTDQMTSNGWKLFDAAIVWAADGATKVCIGLK